MACQVVVHHLSGIHTHCEHTSSSNSSSSSRCDTPLGVDLADAAFCDTCSMLRAAAAPAAAQCAKSQIVVFAPLYAAAFACWQLMTVAAAAVNRVGLNHGGSATPVSSTHCSCGTPVVYLLLSVLVVLHVCPSGGGLMQRWCHHHHPCAC